jgi:hypothetical protein
MTKAEIIKQLKHLIRQWSNGKPSGICYDGPVLYDCAAALKKLVRGSDERKTTSRSV